MSVIGWSLGGIYARMLARRHPEMVRQVITLGSPIHMQLGDASAARPLFDVLSSRFAREAMEEALVPEERREPLSMPSTATYTKGDGIVAWYTCLERPGPQRESIEVRGSHVGLGFNPAVMVAVADRLRQPEGTWRPFRPPPGLGLWYPKAETYRAA